MHFSVLSLRPSAAGRAAGACALAAVRMAVPALAAARTAIVALAAARSAVLTLAAARSAVLALAAAAFLVAGCAEDPAFVERRLLSMGTWVDIALEPPAGRSADAVLEDVETMLRGFEVDYYAWADGELARLNEALAAGRTAVVSEDMAKLLEQAQRAAAASGGAFDPGVGTLVELWGFHTVLETPAPEPAPEVLAAWRAADAGIGALTIDGRRVAARAPGVKLDLGVIAKGQAVDRAIELLRRAGVRNALVNAGGDLRVLGRRGERPWRVGIKDPRADGVLAVVELADGEAAFTSGDYERYVERDGRRLHHILDPRTGRPAEATRAVTVIADGGVEADAAATAIFVAGEDWRAVSQALGIDTVLRVDAAGTVHATRAMQRRLDAGRAEGTDVVAES